MKNKIILQPRDYIVFHSGLKIENIGELVIEFEMPQSTKVYSVVNSEMLNVTYDE